MSGSQSFISSCQISQSSTKPGKHLGRGHIFGREATQPFRTTLPKGILSKKGEVSNKERGKAKGKEEKPLF